MSRKHRPMRSGRPLLGVLPFVAVMTTIAVGQTSRPTTQTQPPTSVLRIAYSKDGLAFTDADKVLVRNASAPALVRLPDGQLLAVFDYGGGSPGGAQTMAVSRSADDGRTWSRPRAIRFSGAGAPGTRCGHASLVLMPNKLLRLYFVALAADKEANREQGSEVATIFSAVSRNGLEYKLDQDVQVRTDGGWDAQPTLVQVGSRIDLYIDSVDDAGSGQKAQGGLAMRLTSPDGRHFRWAVPQRTSGLRFVGSAVSEGKRCRAYLSAEGGVRSMASSDGVVWKPEEGIRLAKGWDPAVVQLKDETFLMLYCAAPDERDRNATQLALASSTNQSNPSVSGASSAEGNSVSAEGGLSQSSTPPTPPSEGGETSDGAGAWDSFAPEAAEAAFALPDDGGNAGGFGPLTGPSGSGGSTPSGGEASDQGMAPLEAVFPAKPDFVTPVDYHGWLQQLFPPNVENNAYDAFVNLAPQSAPFGGERPAWWPETVNDMFNGDYRRPIGPWGAADHPEWETTHQLMQAGLMQFRDVARLPNYACPFMVSPNNPGGPDGKHLMAELLLPSLATNRTLVRATLADAWRAENGQVSPERMTDALETCLRNANQMDQGFTLIHRLVGIAEQSLTQENARAALANNVYQTPEQLESALNVLRQYDQRTGDPAGWIALEHASMMDTMQYVYSPAGPDGRPRINPERARYAFGQLAEGAALDEKLTEAAQVSPEDVQAAIDTVDTHFRELAEKWRVGYPQVRADDIGKLELKNSNTNEPISKSILPSLSRAYELMGRNEASRRGTQLTYAVHLFKARNGRWPSSLDELPAEHGQTMKTDPFTGGQFSYRLGDNGPTIYTAGENGRDDGGVHSPRWTGETEGESDDFVFWPPQPRK